MNEWPELIAVISGVAMIMFVVALHWRGKRGSTAERLGLALFLAGMPLIYVASWIVSPEPGWLLPELGGLMAFGILALIGFRASPWFLAIGIVGHGVFWDAWHYERVKFVPSWYAVACLLTDLLLGAYVTTQIGNFRARANVSSGP